MPKNESRSPILERLKEVLGFYRYADPNYTLRNLAQYCRVSEKTIYNWLKGKTRPKQAKLRLIQEWLESRPKAGGFEDE
ncbi:MAG: helix-turn-helix domain-containing protein [Candidatus Omnitrophica bacterium]|nr:helix-turn-helix domain-containing protein [Candidatus Omnitrophota bacterium]